MKNIARLPKLGKGFRDLITLDVRNMKVKRIKKSRKEINIYTNQGKSGTGYRI